jgi:hypothetical protein
MLEPFTDWVGDAVDSTEEELYLCSARLREKDSGSDGPEFLEVRDGVGSKGEEKGAG